MTGTETSAQASKKPSEISCEEAGALMREFSRENLDTHRLRLLRGHLAGCSDCMSIYREVVGTTAALGRVTRAEREKRAIERQRNQLHAKVFGRKELPKVKRRFFRLRIVLIPAFFIYLMTQIAGVGPPPARIEIISTRGKVTIDQRPVEEGAGPALVLPGRWILSSRFADATVDGRTCELRLGSETDLLVESAAPPRFRFRSGDLQVDGTTTLVTVLGMIEISEGRGHLRLDDHGLLIEPESGSWSVFDRYGETKLEKGHAVTLRP